MLVKKQTSKFELIITQGMTSIEKEETVKNLLNQFKDIEYERIIIRGVILSFCKEKKEDIENVTICNNKGTTKKNDQLNENSADEINKRMNKRIRDYKNDEKARFRMRKKVEKITIDYNEGDSLKQKILIPEDEVQFEITNHISLESGKYMPVQNVLLKGQLVDEHSTNIYAKTYRRLVLGEVQEEKIHEECIQYCSSLLFKELVYNHINENDLSYIYSLFNNSVLGEIIRRSMFSIEEMMLMYPENKPHEFDVRSLINKIIPNVSDVLRYKFHNIDNFVK